MLKGVDIIKFILLVFILIKLCFIQDMLDKHHEMTIIGLNVVGRTLDEIEKEMREYER